MGRAAFVSHQWLTKHHPDPQLSQMRILQDAVQRLLTSRSESVSLDLLTEALVRPARPLPMQEFQKQPLFFWYDYFSCPQPEQCEPEERDGQLARQLQAIDSIPAYVAKCHFFLALCPVLESSEANQMLTAATWSRRGWCRVERAARELSRNSTWILIQSTTSMEVVGTAMSFPPGTVAEGEFTFARDRQKLAPVMRHIVLRKLNQLLKAGDLPAFRRHFNLQTVHLRGLETEPLGGFLPSSQGQGTVSEFLHQNGLRSVTRADSAGWRPLHYAALAGNTVVLSGLLEQPADVNKRTSQDEPMLGLPRWMSALDLAAHYKHRAATKLLLAAKAHIEGGVLPAIHYAGNADDAEGVRLLHVAAGQLQPRNSALGVSCFESAAGHGASEAR